MKRNWTIFPAALAAMIVVACDETSDRTPLSTSSLTDLATGSSSIGGNIVDADSMPAANGKVTIYLVSALSPDTLPPDSTPPDSTLPPPPPPPDSTPPDSGLSGSTYGIFRGDTLPGDSVPQPPAGECGKRGEKVAQVRTDENGIFQITGLEPGVYDVEAKDQGARGSICGLIVRDNQAVFVTVMLN